MKVLVCGGAGYIGSHMCKLLAEHGHEVAVVDDLSTGHQAAVRWGHLHHGDIGDDAFMAAVFRSFRPDGVFHFAARSIVAESAADPALYYRSNTARSLALLEHVRRAEGCVFVFSSTAAVYGVPDGAQVAESHALKPINVYGRSKAMIEQMLSDYWSAYGLPSVSLRYFNAAGADASGEIGEAHDPETHLIPRLLESALGRLEPVGIFGDDYDTPDGSCIRDYIHVDDLCRAHLSGFERVLRHPGAYCYNLGSGRGYSVKETLSAAEAVVGRRIEVRVGARRHGDPPRLVADARRAARELGWQPVTPELERIIESAWRWHRARRY